MIKRLQTLVWWVMDQQKSGLTLTAVDFDAAAMNQASEMKTLRRERVEKEPSITDLGKFDPDDFDSHKDAFLNLLAQSFGVLRKQLHYIICPEAAPAEFATTEKERMYQFPLTGGSFELDNQTIYCKLKAFLIDLPGWAWIELHDTAEDGRAVFITWTEHYHNGEGELSERTAMAKSKLENLHYKNERSMSFERCTKIMTKCFNTLHKDPDQRFSDCQKVEKLLKAIRCSDPELLAAKAIIDQNFPRNFISACGYFLQQVARIHGPAQLEYHQSRHRKRGISAFDTRPNHGGRGRGRFGNHSGGGGSGQGDHGRGHGGRSYGNHVINGIDVSDPNRSFTAQEWEVLGPNGGQTTVMQMQER
jgi:hypothetical protein